MPLLGDTRRQMLGQLAQGPRTAIQVASALGIQVSAARKHLERLRSAGIVAERFERSGPGRPKKFYNLTEEGQELFPRRYDALLNAILDKLVRVEGEPHAERILHGVADDLVRGAHLEAGSDRPHVRKLVAALEGLGFEPEVAFSGRACTITSHNCPILRTAKAHRELVCRGVHAEILRQGSGASAIERGKWIVDGDPTCTHVLRLDGDSPKPSARSRAGTTARPA